MAHKTTQAQLDEIRALLEQGMTGREVSRITGVHEGTICRLKARGLLGNSYAGVRDKAGEVAGQIDMKHTGLKPLPPGRRIDGSPEVTAPPEKREETKTGEAPMEPEAAEEPEAEEEPEAMEEPEPKEPEAAEEAAEEPEEEPETTEAPAAAEPKRGIRKTVKLVGRYCVCEYAKNESYRFDAMLDRRFDSAAELAEMVDQLVEELTEIKDVVLREE